MGDLNFAQGLRHIYNDFQTLDPLTAGDFNRIRTGFHTVKAGLNIGRDLFQTFRNRNTTSTGEQPGDFFRTPISDHQRASRSSMPHFGRRRFNGTRRRMVRRRAPVRRGRTRPIRGRRATTLAIASTGMARPTITAIGRSPNFKGAVFPRSLQATLITGELSTITTGTQVYPEYMTVASVILNSAVDPFLTPASTIQALYYDQLKGIYNVTIVTAAVITVQVVETSTTKTMEVVTLTALGDETAGPTTAVAMASPKCTHFTVAGRTTDPTNRVNVKRYVNMNRFFTTTVNDNKTRFEESDAIVSPTTNQCRFNMFVRHVDGTNLASETVTLKISLKQWVTFTDLKSVEDVPPG